MSEERTKQSKTSLKPSWPDYNKWRSPFLIRYNKFVQIWYILLDSDSPTLKLRN